MAHETTKKADPAKDAATPKAPGGEAEGGKKKDLLKGAEGVDAQEKALKPPDQKDDKKKGS